MKITVIYGDDTLASHKRFLQIIDGVRARGWEIVFLNRVGNGIAESFAGNSLFEANKLFVLESTKLDLSWLRKNFETFDSNLLIYIDGQIPRNLQFIKPKHARFEEYKLPKTIFTF